MSRDGTEREESAQEQGGSGDRHGSARYGNSHLQCREAAPVRDGGEHTASPHRETAQRSTLTSCRAFLSEVLVIF